MKIVTVDLGATNAKIHEARFNGDVLKLKEILRFGTRGQYLPNVNRDMLVWNLPKFYSIIRDVLQSLREVKGVSFSSWGVDFSLFDEQGRLLMLPYHYRDERTKGVMEKFLASFDRYKLYHITGIQFMPINTLYQLYSMVISNDPLLNITRKMLMIADTFVYWFSGEMVSEYTLSSTSQIIDLRSKKWSKEVIKAIGIDEKIFPRLVDPGTVIGKCKCGDIDVIASALHDTASAVLSVPFNNNGIFVSSGTWSIIGTELEKPIVSDEAFKEGFTNEGGFGGVVRFSKNTTGMWILEECNRVLKKSYEQIIEMAESTQTSKWIDPDHPDFLSPGDMITRISLWLKNSGQGDFESLAELIRIIFESMAFNYAFVVENLERITRKHFETIHVVGGGARNNFLNQLIANVTAKEVAAGPYEATSIGNALGQLIALGEIADVSEAREIVRRSFRIQKFYPRDTITWRDKYNLWRNNVKKTLKS